MKKLIIILFLLFPLFVFAQTESNDTYFKAEVEKVTAQEENILPDGTEVTQQNLLLKGSEGRYEGKEVEFNGIGGFDVVGKNIYKEGDKVLVVESFDAEGNSVFYVTDYVRTGAMFWLAIIFVLSILIIGKFKGLRSIISLVLTFVVIIKYIIPQILSGADPIIVTIIGSFLILLIIIYVTEGFQKLSHISIVSIFFSLLITVFVSWFFVELAKLTGVFSEDISYLANIGGDVINFKGLLLAGIIIGTLGVLDDVVIAQVATTEEINKANPALSRKEVFARSYKVGVSHIASMTNTLFLAYAGVSLPLLILFLSGKSAFMSWAQIMNNEAIATEIVRTLSGSIGLILAVPIATLIATWWYKRK